MSNAYFQFKQFTIWQDRCAMKVCTDACILGAWTANKIPEKARILDIGSGTGLLMLMLAQKNEGIIEGIEYDEAAFKQQEENISSGKWANRLKAIHGDMRSHIFNVLPDFIIVNPPFFESDLLSADERKNLAKHSSGLTLQVLIQRIRELLNDNGEFVILLPFHRTAYLEILAGAHGFFLKEKLLIRQSVNHDFFRSILHFSLKKETPVNGELIIKDAQDNYTAAFTNLMKDYYLNL